MRRMLLVLSLAGVLAGCGPESPRAAQIASIQGNAAHGHALFAANCSGCHKAEGFSKMLGWYPQKAFLSTVVTGVPKTKMPSFSHLSDQDIADIYAGLKTP